MNDRIWARSAKELWRLYSAALIAVTISVVVLSSLDEPATLFWSPPILLFGLLSIAVMVSALTDADAHATIAAIRVRDRVRDEPRS